MPDSGVLLEDNGVTLRMDNVVIMVVNARRRKFAILTSITVKELQQRPCIVEERGRTTWG